MARARFPSSFPGHCEASTQIGPLVIFNATATKVTNDWSGVMSVRNPDWKESPLSMNRVGTV